MSTTPTSVGIPVHRWSVKQYAVLIALMLALVAGAFGVYSLSSPNEATTAPSTTLVEDGRAGGDGCRTRLDVAGGRLEGQSYNDTCGSLGGSVVPGGLRAR